MPTCWNCDRDFDTSQSLIQHLANSRTPHPYCKYCDRCFTSENRLAKHNRDFHYPCSVCDRVLGSIQALRQHNRDAEDHTYCRTCERSFPSPAGLRAHIRDSPIHDGPTQTFRWKPWNESATGKREVVRVPIVIPVARTIVWDPKDIPLPASPVESESGPRDLDQLETERELESHIVAGLERVVGSLAFPIL